MKKTLVAILALGGMAMASDLLTLDNAKAAFTIKDGSITSVAGEDFTVTDNTLTLNSGEKWGADVATDRTRTEITIALTFDMAKAQGLTAATKLIQLGTNWGVGVTGDPRFTGVWGNNASYYQTYTISQTEGTRSIVITLDNAGTRIFDGNDTAFYTNTGLKGDCNSTNLTISDLGMQALTGVVIWSEDAYDVSTEAGKAKLNSAFTALSSLPVPEPATATLSLLALAGLAARRRRH